MILLPTLVVLACWQIGLDQIDVGILTALFMVSAAPPVMSTPIIIWMYGMNGALAFSISVLSLISAPITTAFFASMILPAPLQVDPYDLAINLAGFLLGSAGLGRFLYYAFGWSETR